MNICVLSNYTKTYLYDKIAEVLSKEGIKTFWIAVNRSLYQFLAEKYGEEQVLLINKKHINQPNKIVGELKINELIYGDRVLKHDPANGRKFLRNIQQPIYDFLKNNQIRYAFGETTWAHEVLTHRMCTIRKDLNCQYLDLHSVRIPYNRFAFFPEEGQGRLFRVDKTLDTPVPDIQPKKPDYAKIFDTQLAQASSLAGRLNRIKRFFSDENMDDEDPTLLNNTLKRLQVCGQEEWQKETYKKIKKTPFDTIEKKPYVFVGLHKQPEASVDVFGRYYEDQLQNIKNLWRALPDDWNLLVKEHSNAVGDRANAFYQEIQALPNTYLIEEKTDSYRVMKEASLIATVTGTMAYEAALMGIPSITFVPLFFNFLNHCQRITLEDLNQYNLREIAESIKAKESNVSEFSAFLYANTFVGNVIDPLTDERVLAPKNIQSISQAMLHVIQPAMVV